MQLVSGVQAGEIDRAAVGNHLIEIYSTTKCKFALGGMDLPMPFQSKRSRFASTIGAVEDGFVDQPSLVML
ncbi:MAG TPA: hypothetical protein VM260_00710, partial [Pirellula sp.]|nr:hypothetical protein [Pirellula sp.]